MLCQQNACASASAYLVERVSLRVVGDLSGLPVRVHRALDEVLVHDPDQGVVFVEPELGEERLPDLVDVAHNDRGEEDLGQGDAAVEGGLHRGLEELAGVVVQEKTARDDGGHDNQSPKGGLKGRTSSRGSGGRLPESPWRGEDGGLPLPVLVRGRDEVDLRHPGGLEDRNLRGCCQVRTTKAWRLISIAIRRGGETV